MVSYHFEKDSLYGRSGLRQGLHAIAVQALARGQRLGGKPPVHGWIHAKDKLATKLSGELSGVRQGDAIFLEQLNPFLTDFT